VVLQLLPNKRV